LNAIDQAVAFLDQAHAGPSQITNSLVLAAWNEGSFQQTMLQQIRNPFCIFHVRFSPRYGFHMLGTEGHDLEGVFEQVIKGFPKHASGFHRNLPTT